MVSFAAFAYKDIPDLINCLKRKHWLLVHQTRGLIMPKILMIYALAVVSLNR